MSAMSMSRGHRLKWTAEAWRYSDGSLFDDSWPCTACGIPHIPHGPDACLGVLPGVSAACCGHGIAEPYFISTAHVLTEAELGITPEREWSGALAAWWYGFTFVFRYAYRAVGFRHVVRHPNERMTGRWQEVGG